jgi:hypothetical protein
MKEEEEEEEEDQLISTIVGENISFVNTSVSYDDQVSGTVCIGVARPFAKTRGDFSPESGVSRWTYEIGDEKLC